MKTEPHRKTARNNPPGCCRPLPGRLTLECFAVVAFSSPNRRGCASTRRADPVREGVPLAGKATFRPPGPPGRERFPPGAGRLGRPGGIFSAGQRPATAISCCTVYILHIRTARAKSLNIYGQNG